ncbi:hypothetical protein [Bacteroides sp. 51]|uniref:hypothetical protein n=1 Tax=Bacteroides sp. 51 TaxID=2302938 RepID=UPI001EF16617|nr:hypothetical protein [Bacteroides sp. 51]
MEDGIESYECLEDIISLRASFLINRVLEGLRIDFDTALSLLKKHNNHITEREKAELEILIAAIDNLVDFAAYGQVKMMQELPEERYLQGKDLYETTFRKYNLDYARTENADVLHAATIACFWLGMPDSSILTYMTQGDERVRAWHLSLEGISFPKKDFPPGLIPPIEHGCRCYLLSDQIQRIYGSIKAESYNGHVNPVFSESLATGGRIFSLAHPYFSVKLPRKIRECINKIKSAYYYHEQTNS